MSALLPLVLGGIGLYLLVWAARTGLATARPSAPPPARAAPGQVVQVAGQVLAPWTPLASPLQGAACAYWHVRAVRIRDRNISAGAAGVQVQVDAALSAPVTFTVRTEDGDVVVDGSASRMASGLQVIHRDQGSVARTLDVAGQRVELPAVAHGSRQVKEGILVPGTPVWITGRLATSADGPVVRGDPADPVVIDTTPPSTRRATAGAIVLVSAVIGLGLIAAAAGLLSG